MDHSIKRSIEKNQRRDHRKKEILVAAETLFMTKGIKNTKMIDIAKVSELGKATLYFYFKSKDEIVWTLLKEHSLKEYEAGRDYIEGAGGTGYEKLARYFKLFSEELIDSYHVSNPSFQYREYMASMVVNDDLTDDMKIEYQTIVKRNMSIVADAIETGIGDGSVNPIDTAAVSNGIGAAFGTYFRYVIGLKASFDDDYVNEHKDYLKAYLDFILSALKK